MAEYKTTVTETEDGGRTITSGNMTEEQAARLAAERERTKNMNTSDSASAALDALAKDIAAKKRYTEMQNILASGKHKSMSDEEKAAFVKEYKKLKLDYSFNEGGTVPMNNTAKQMDMFDEGGLMDEGGTTDPVSGNDVPPGSTQEEVRDDIPAQLSEGEFVFPADVVRFIGLEKLMKIRQQAKAGLQRMEDMGQMGNSEEAIMPDDVPFTIDDLDMEDDGLEMAQGGLVNMANGGVMPGSNLFSGQITTGFPVSGAAPVGGGIVPAPPGIFGTNPNPNPYNLPTIPTTGTVSGSGTIGGVPISGTASGAIGQAAAPMQAASQGIFPVLSQTGQGFFPQYPQGFVAPPINLPPTDPATGQTKLPTFYEMVGQPGGAGQQQTTTPDPNAGTTPDPSAIARQQSADTGDSDESGYNPSIFGTTDTTKGELDFSNLGKLGAEAKRAFNNLTDSIGNLFGIDGGLGDRIDAEAMEGLSSTPGSYLVGDIFESAAGKSTALGGSENYGFSNPALRSATLAQAGYELGSFAPLGVATAVLQGLGVMDFKIGDIQQEGYNGMKAALNSLGLTNRGQLFNNEQATLVGTAMAAAHAATLKNKDPKAAYEKVLNTPAAKQMQRNSYNTIKSSFEENNGLKKLSDAEFVSEMAKVERAAVDDLKKGFTRQTPRTSKPGQAADASFRSNVITDSRGNAIKSTDYNASAKAGKKVEVPVLSDKGKRTKDRLNSRINQAKVLQGQGNRFLEETRQKYRDDFVSDSGAGFGEGQPTQPTRDEAAELAKSVSPARDTSAVADTRYTAETDDDFGGGGDDGGYDPSSDAGGFSGSSGSYGGYDDYLNKGGLATQMKRSGLASKK